MSKINLHKLSITVIINVLLISLFIGLLFFTYGAYIENNVVKTQMKILSDDITNFVRLGGVHVNNTVSNFFMNLQVPDLTHEDKEVANNNKKVLKKAIIANVIFTILVIISVFFIYRSSEKNFSMKTLLSQNMILLIFIGFTEFSFLTFFGAKYVSIDPNFIKLKIVENIEKSIKDKPTTITDHHEYH